MLETSLGRLDERVVIEGGWRAEALAVLAWALKRFELPSSDEQIEAWEVTEAIGMADPELPEDLLATPGIRTTAAIEQLADELFAAHWRIRGFGLRPEPLDFATVAATTWFGPLVIDRLPLVDGDLGIRGDAISRADPGVLSEVESIVLERRAPAGWLRGEDKALSEVPLDT